MPDRALIDLGPDDSVRLYVAGGVSVTLTAAQLRACAVVLRYCLLTGEPLNLEIVGEDGLDEDDLDTAAGWQGECGGELTGDLHPGPWEALIELAGMLEGTPKEDHP